MGILLMERIFSGEFHDLLLAGKRAFLAFLSLILRLLELLFSKGLDSYYENLQTPANNVLFPNAKIFVQKKELEYAINPLPHYVYGDCIGLFENWEGNGIYKHIPSGIHYSLPEYFKTFDKHRENMRSYFAGP